jgi:hypothetical protein
MLNCDLDTTAIGFMYNVCGVIGVRQDGLKS